ncbi:enoyl-CoA hydratase-related protein [Pseudonocardia ailaonensis]|uniref:Enoyl-CoA hydratase-related protein n=1 Tax=Pseudonocardia ailaonensis TaxID=367279 RepID=A0ABN2ML93_9PSEU
MPDFTSLHVDVEGDLVTVTLDRAPVNAVDIALYREIQQVFLGIESLAPKAKAAILTGAGKHFCGGNELSEFRTMNPVNTGERMFEVRSAFFAISDCPIPVIAAVGGSAVGTGLALAASADAIIAAEDAVFSLPEIGAGAMGGARHLARLVPFPVVRSMHLTADRVPAADLARYGGIARVVPREELMEAAREFAGRITRHSRVAVKLAKRSLNRIESLPLKEGYEYEQSLTAELSGHPDSKEAVNSFLERRPPRYADV